jgi:hypothetical protein
VSATGSAVTPFPGELAPGIPARVPPVTAQEPLADLREAIATPTIGRCPHCRQPVTLVTQIAAPPDTGAGPVPPS